MYIDLHAVNFKGFRIKHRDRAAQVPLTLNPSQQLVIDRLMNQCRAGLPAWGIILKARRGGIST